MKIFVDIADGRYCDGCQYLVHDESEEKYGDSRIWNNYECHLFEESLVKNKNKFLKTKECFKAIEERKRDNEKKL